MNQDFQQPMGPEERQKGRQMVRHGCFTWLFIGVLHSIVWGALAFPVLTTDDWVGAVIVGGILGTVALCTLPLFLGLYIRFFFATRSYILVDLLLGRVEVLRGRVESTRVREYRSSDFRRSMYGKRFMTVDGREYDTSLFSAQQPDVGQRVELRFGARTGVLCGVVVLGDDS